MAPSHPYYFNEIQNGYDGPYSVGYLCLRQSPNWQHSPVPQPNLEQAKMLAQAVKPGSPNGRARVLNRYGQVVYQI